MQSLPKSIAVLSFVLLALTVGADPAPDAASSAPAVVAHLGKTEARTHVHVELNRTDVTDVTVELFDAEGAAIHTYALEPRKDGVYRPMMTIDVAEVLAPRVETARVTAFSISSSSREALFDTGMIEAQVNPCANQCDYTRIECHNDCFLAGCISATYSCTGELGSCVHNCTCLECGQ